MPEPINRCTQLVEIGRAALFEGQMGSPPVELEVTCCISRSWGDALQEHVVQS